MTKIIMYCTATLLIAAACTNQNTTIQQMSVADVEQNATGDGWKVDQFDDEGKVYTSYFSGWTFDFAKDGTMIAHSSQGDSYTGSWFIQTDDSDPVKEFHISIQGPSTLMEMNEDWNFKSSDKSTISLQDLDKGAVKATLIFVK